MTDNLVNTNEKQTIQLLNNEVSFFFGRLRDICDKERATLARNLADPPQGLSVRHLNRKLTPAILRPSMLCVNALRQRRVEFFDCFRHVWLRNLRGDNPVNRTHIMDKEIGCIAKQMGGHLG